jgi:stringent starvation protein B
VPIDHVVAIYARENGQGMAFPAPSAPGGAGLAPVSTGETGPRHGPRLTSVDAPASDAGEAEPPEPPPGGGARPALKRIK